MADDYFMRLAIDMAKEGVLKGNAPFGACIVKDDEIIVCEHNRVWGDTDITAHAEIVAIREACKKLGSIDLGGMVLYATCEPCPMCFSAAHWAGITKIVFGARIKDAKKMKFRELNISNEKMIETARSKVESVGPFMRQENLDLMDYWNDIPGTKSY